MRLTINYDRSFRFRTGDASDDWKEEHHKRDANGKFSKMAGHLGLPASAASMFGLSHTEKGQNGWKAASEKLTAKGFKPVPGGFTKGHNPNAKYSSSQKFIHPEHGHQATVHYTEFSGSEPVTLTSVIPNEPGKTKPAAPAAPASAPDDFASKVEAYLASKKAAPAAPASSASEFEAWVNGPDKALLAKANVILPKIEDAKSEQSKQDYAKFLGEIDAALKSPDPKAALAAVKIDKKYPKAVAYKALLEAAHGGKTTAAAVAPSAAPGPSVHSNHEAFAKANTIRPDPEAMQHPASKAAVASALKKIDAALASPDPFTALQAVPIAPRFSKVIAYRNMMVDAHKPGTATGIAAPAAPASQTMPAPPKNAVGNFLFSGKTIKGEEVKAQLKLSMDKMDKQFEGIKQLDHSKWYALGDKIRYGSSSAEAQASSYYQGSGHSPMNRALAGIDPMTPKIEAQCKALDEVIAKTVVPADVKLTRGIGASLQAVTGAPDAASAVGGVFVHKGFASAGRTGGFSGRETMMHFTLPKGAHALPMPKLTTEDEIVVPRNGLFRIDKVEKIGSQHHLHCTYLGVRA